MPQALYILFGAVFTAAVSWAAGRLLFHRLAIRLYEQEEHLLAFVTGSACLSLLVFLLACVGLVRKGVLLALGVLILGAAIRKGLYKATGAPLPPLPRVWTVVLGLAFALFGALYLANAMAPEISPDGGAYHLRFVADYCRAHGFVRITTNLYANLSQGLELLFLFAYAFGRHSAAAMVHLWFLLALPLLMLGYARRHGFPAAGAAGALFTFLSPVVGIDGISAYNDVAVACVLFALFYLLEIWALQRRSSLLIPAGILAGFGYAIKYTAFLAVPYALIYVGWKSWRSRQKLLRPLVVVALCALVMIAPWVLKNWFWMGNPFSPFFNSWFPNPYVHVIFEEEYSRHMRHYPTIDSYRKIPLEVTVHGAALCGLLGPLFLLAPLSLVALRHPTGRRLLLAGAVFGSTYFTNIGTRFLIPAVPFVSLAMGLAASGVPGLALVLVLAHSLLSWPDVLKKYCTNYAWRLDRIVWKQALRIESEDAWLSRTAPQYNIARMVETQVPPGGKVLSFNQIAEAYTSRQVLVSFQAAQNYVLTDIFRAPLAAEFAPTWHLAFRFPAQPLRRVRVVQTAGGAPDVWSVSELRLFRAGQQLPRSPSWRLRAHPNPWDVQLAFDNRLVTRWRSWQRLQPGMFIEVDFRRPETIDMLRVEAPHDQYQIRLKLEAMDAQGRWKTIADATELSDQPPPPGLRRAAVGELKARGITHLLIWDSDFGADEIRVNALIWGVTLVREMGPVRLYHLN